MAFSIVSLRSLVLLALLASSLLEARNVVKREQDSEATVANEATSGHDESESDSDSGESRADTTTEKPEKPDEPDEPEDSDGSRSGAAAAVAATVAAVSSSASASASVGAGATASALAEVGTEALLGSASSSAGASASASSSSETSLESRSGASSEKEADDESEPAKDKDEDSGRDKEHKKEEKSGKGNGTDGESRAGFFDFLPKGSAGLDLSFFQNMNKTVVLSMKASVNSNNGQNGAKSTPGPQLILNRNGTKLMSEGGTMRPVKEEKAKEIVARAKNDPKSFKIETFESFREYDEFTKETNNTEVHSRQLLINGQTTTTTAAPATTKTTTKSPSMRPSTVGPVTSSTTSKKPTLVPTKAAIESSSTTTKPVLPSSTLKPSEKPVLSTSKRPAPSTQRPTVAQSTTVKPTCPSCAPCKSADKPIGGCGSSGVADLQTGDKLLAVVVTNKGHFKGRRISTKAIGAIMNAPTGQLDTPLTVSSNNSFVFPAGHYYFPKPIRFAGFRSP